MFVQHVSRASHLHDALYVSSSKSSQPPFVIDSRVFLVYRIPSYSWFQKRWALTMDLEQRERAGSQEKATMGKNGNAG